MSDRDGRPWLAPLAICLLSLIPRLPNLDAPPLDRHDFRQTQTAITVQAFLDRGVSALGYETPVFGPPWRVPFEFPTYQLSAVPFARLGLSLETACRLVALLWFYAGAALLFAVVARACGRRLALLSLGAYVAMPFTVFWSRAILIDFASVALSLAYLYLAMRWADRPSALALAGGIAVGALAAATKLTTLAAVAAPMAAVGGAALWRTFRASSAWRERIAVVAALASLAAVPLAAGVAWTRYADAVKAENPYTRWLTSDALRTWNFGTLAQRLKPRCWWILADRIHDTMVPGIFVLLLAAAAVAVVLRAGAIRQAIVVATLGVLAPIAIFFNLFVVHDYYLISVTPWIAVLVAAGADAVLSIRFQLRGVALGTAAALAVIGARPGWDYLELAYRPWRMSNLVPLAAQVAAATPEDGWVAVQGDDWNPRILYLAHRRGIMIRPGAGDFTSLGGESRVRTLVCSTCPADVLAMWPERRKVGRAAGFDVFQLAAAAGGSIGLKTGSPQ